MDTINLISFDDSPPKNPIVTASNKVFGLIKRECIVSDVSSLYDNNDEPLAPGNLIEIIPDYHNGTESHIKIRDFTNLLNKYKTTIYRCRKDDYVVVSKESWPYLVALKNDYGRIKFVQNVYSRKFDLDIMKFGRTLRIRAPSGASMKYYKFKVVHNGLIKEIGPGYYIGLKFMNDIKEYTLPSSFKDLSHYYRFGGVGIVVSADWIMMNLYEEIKTPQKCDSPVISVNKESILDNKPQAITNMGAIPKPNSRPSQQLCDSNLTYANNHKDFQKLPATNIIKDPNARICSNESCKHIWVTSDREHKNNERCPKCKTNWCNLCSSAHEPGQRHGSQPNKKIDKTISNPVVLGNCIKCHKSNIALTECFTLQNCNHSFCNNCIVPMIRTQLSKSQDAQCTFCRKALHEDEILKLTGIKIFKKFDIPKPVVERKRMCCCRPPASNCFIELNCKHKLCQTLLTGILKGQQDYGSRASCPVCFENVDDNVMKMLFKQTIKSADVVKCDHCEQNVGKRLVHVCEQYDNLLICIECAKPSNFDVPNHRTNSRADFKKSYSFQCTFCHKNQSDSPISTINKVNRNMPVTPYRNEIKSKNYPIPLDIFTCPGCLQSLDCGFQIELKICKHKICRNCLNVEISSRKLSTAKCPVCNEHIDQNQLDAYGILPNVSSSDNVQNLDKCSVCLEKYNQRTTLKPCGHTFCRGCVYNSVMSQHLNEITAGCPMCRQQIDLDQITDLKKPINNLTLRKRNTVSLLNSRAITPLQLNSAPFECILCDKWIDSECGVVLGSCRDEFCRDCITNVILQQTSNKLVPICPMCLGPIADEEVRTLDEAMYAVFLENRLERNMWQ